MYIRAPGPHSNANRESDLFRNPNQFGFGGGGRAMFWGIKGKWCLSCSDKDSDFSIWWSWAQILSGLEPKMDFWLGAKCGGSLKSRHCTHQEIHLALPKMHIIPAVISKPLAHEERINIKSESLNLAGSVVFEREMAGIAKGRSSGNGKWGIGISRSERGRDWHIEEIRKYLYSPPSDSSIWAPVYSQTSHENWQLGFRNQLWKIRCNIHVYISGGTLLWDNRRLIGRSLIVLARKVQNNRD